MTNGATAPGSGRRLLIINANTDAAMTERLVLAAQRHVSPEVAIVSATARFGARYIATRVAYAIAEHAALDAFAEHGAGANVVLLGCFGDPGLAALREVAAVPVVGMAEASCRRAAQRFRRFSIVTGGSRWPAMLREFLAAFGLAEPIARIRAIEATGGQIAADPIGSHNALIQECIAAAQEDGAEAVILGGAGLTGIAKTISRNVPVPVLDSYEEALQAAQTELLSSRDEKRDLAKIPEAEMSGLSLSLSALVSRRHRAGPS